MGFLECAGCALLAFSAPFSLFIYFVVPDPLRIIIFVGSAFFWLLSLLASSLLWYAIVPLRSTLAFGLFVSVLFQELFRFLYYMVLKKAEQGLEKVSSRGMHIEGVHSLKNARHTTAFVCGLGYGVMSGAFALANVLASANGTGTLGLPAILKLSNHFGDHTFFFTSALMCSIMILLNVAWNVILWYSCENKNYIYGAAVVLSHALVSGSTLLNQLKLYYLSLIIGYLVLFIAGWTSYSLYGGTFGRVGLFVKRCFTCTFLLSSTTDDASQVPPEANPANGH